MAGDIKIEKVNIEKIDGKYLPDGYPYVAEVTAFNRIVDIADYDGHDWYYAWYGVDEPLYHKLGEKATVEFDGESYHLSVLDFENSKVLGDMVVMNQGSTPIYPFVITIDHMGGMVIACRKQITTKVKILIPEVKTIDPKYLPGGGGGQTILYIEWPYLNKSEGLEESNRVSKSELLGYATNGSIVLTYPKDPDYGPDYWPERYYPLGVFDSGDHAYVIAYDGGGFSYFNSKEFVNDSGAEN